MSASYSVSDARRSLPQIFRDAENGGEAHITRRGEVVAVLVGANEFERNESGRLDFVQAYERFRARVDPNDLIPDVDEFLRGIRDPSPVGRSTLPNEIRAGLRTTPQIDMLERQL